MKPTSFFLDDASVEVLEKFFCGKQSLSCAIRLALDKLLSDGFPVRIYGRQQCVGDGCRRVRVTRRVRVSLPDGLYIYLNKRFPGLNLSFTLREYLRTQFFL